LQKQGFIMKRSKIFLGVTTCLLAIAGVAATKAHYQGTITKAYYVTSNNLTHCYQLTGIYPCPQAGTGCVTALANPGGTKTDYQLYLSKVSITGCKTKLQFGSN
jgi:hypothetical protein